MKMGRRTNYEKGADKERRIVNKFRERGCLSFRSAGSHSPIDIFAIDPETKIIHLVQSKPKSMSWAKKEELYRSLQYLEGTYIVQVFVE